MFTGLIEAKGIITDILQKQQGLQLSIAANFSSPHPKKGESIAINGVCLTKTNEQPDIHDFYVSYKTAEITTISNFLVKDTVNMERAMLATDRFGGHMVSGHIDTTGIISSVANKADGVLGIFIAIDEKFKQFILEKGSVAVDGISLTIVSVNENTMELVIIPETVAQTNVASWKSGNMVNLEFDMIIKYVDSLLSRYKN